MKRFVGIDASVMLIAVSLGALLLFSTGCWSSGTAVDAQQMEEFKKGVTTRREIEGKIGSADSVQIFQDGSRHAHYMHIASNTTAEQWIPGVQYFAGGSKTRIQQLEVVYKDGSPDSVMTDYELTDKTTQGAGGVVNPHTESTK